MHAKISRFETDLCEWEQAAEKAQEEYQGALALKQLEERKVLLENYCAWAHLDESVAEIAIRMEVAEKSKLAAAAAEAVQKDLAKGISEKEAEISTIEKESKRMQVQLNKMNEQGKELQKQDAEERKQRHKCERKVKDTALAIEMAKETLEDHKAMFAEQSDKLENVAREAVEQYKQKRSQLKMDHMAAVQTVQAADAEVEANITRYESTKSNTDTLRRAADELQAPLDDARSQLELMRKKGFDMMQLMHPQMRELVKRVEAQSRSFDSPPIGPIGRYVKLNNGCEDDARVIERALGGDRALGESLAPFFPSCHTPFSPCITVFFLPI